MTVTAKKALKDWHLDRRSRSRSSDLLLGVINGRINYFRFFYDYTPGLVHDDNNWVATANWESSKLTAVHPDKRKMIEAVFTNFTDKRHKV